MPVANAHQSARLKRLLMVAAYLGAVLTLTACGLSKQETAALLPPAVVAEAKLRAQAEAMTCATTPGKPACPPGAPANIPGAAPLETGSIPKTAQPVQSAPAVQAAASVTTPQSSKSASPEELYIDFQAGSVTLSEREKLAVKEAVGARVLSGDVRVRIAAARGGSGNWFDQATIADKRARFVNGILPNTMVDSVEFDPNLPEDTVRLEFYRPAKRTN